MSKHIEQALEQVKEMGYSKQVPDSWKLQYSGETKLEFQKNQSLESRVNSILEAKDNVNIFGLNFKVNGQEHWIDDSEVNL